MKLSFQNALQGGRWGVSQFHYWWHDYVFVYWTEDTSLQVDFTTDNAGHQHVVASSPTSNFCYLEIDDYWGGSTPGTIGTSGGDCYPPGSGGVGTQDVSADNGAGAWTHNLFVYSDHINYPAGYAGKIIPSGQKSTQNIPSLAITGTVADYEPWSDPTSQPLVGLSARITNADGTPAVGAIVKFSNAAPNAVWTVPSDGTVNVVEDISKGIQDVTITATKGPETVSKVVHIFDVAQMTECHLPGEARQTDAISSLLDNMLIETDAGPLLEMSQNVIDMLGKAVSAVPDKVTTVGSAQRYTGTFTPIYQLSVSVTNNADGSVVKQYPEVFSRNYDLVRPLFEGDGTPIQRLGRSLVCGVTA